MNSGKLRHRITFEERQEIVVEGDRTWAWVVVFPNVPAEFLSGPGREFLAAEAIRAETVGRFEIRYLEGVTALMRIRWAAQIWNIKAPPIIDRTARRQMTLLVGSGVNDG